jgi:hypothetical protein
MGLLVRLSALRLGLSRSPLKNEWNMHGGTSWAAAHARLDNHGHVRNCPAENSIASGRRCPALVATLLDSCVASVILTGSPPEWLGWQDAMKSHREFSSPLLLPGAIMGLASPSIIGFFHFLALISSALDAPYSLCLQFAVPSEDAVGNMSRGPRDSATAGRSGRRRSLAIRLRRPAPRPHS